MKRAWMPLLTLAIFSGCKTVDVEPKLTFEPPVYVQELPSKELDDEMPHAGSLFGQGDNPLFIDRKAMKINDIVTVIINEKASASSKAQKKLAQANNSNLGGGQLEFTGKENHQSQYFQGLNDLGNYNYKSASTADYQGQGSVNRDESFNSTMTVRIVKVMNNGNYFIHGKRQLLINGEKQILQLSGVISPFDINQKNEVKSSKISDARIAYLTEGDIHQSTKQGSGTRAIEALWPF